MSSTRPSLAAEQREITGKKVAAIRRAGRLPAVVYGKDVPSTNISLDSKEFDALRRAVGPNALIDLTIDGKKARPVLVHGIAVHPVERNALHVDLLAVQMTQELVVDVQLVATGESEAVTREGGTLIHPIETVKIRALPDHLPRAIEYDIAALVDFDATIKVEDLAIPEDVTLLTDPGEIVAKVLAPRVEEKPAEAEALEGVAEGVPEAQSGPAAEGGEPATAEDSEA